MRARTDSKRSARALDDLRKGVSRGDAERALAGWVALSETDAAPHTEVVLALVDRDVKKAHAAADWSRLTFWAARLEPALASRLASRESSEGLSTSTLDRTELLWPLLSASVIARTWDRADRFLDALEATAGSSKLLTAMRCLIVTKGAPDEETWSALGLPELPRDPRLGVEPMAPRSNVACPAAHSEVEHALMMLKAREPWAVFEATVDRWLSEAKGEVAREIRSTASDLAMHEALTRTQNETAPLALFARCQEGAPEAALLAFRLCLRALDADAASRPSPSTFAAIARRVASVEAHRNVATSALEGMVDKPALSDWTLAALEALHDVAPSLPSWLAGARLLGARANAKITLTRNASSLHERPRPTPVPSWIERHLSSYLAASAREIAPLVSKGNHLSVAIVGVFARSLPPHRFVELIRALWPHASEPTRATLATAVGMFVEHVSADKDDDLFGFLSLDEFRAMSPEGRRAWTELEPLVLRYDAAFLPIALDRVAPAIAASKDVIERFLEGSPPVEHWLIAYREADERGFDAIARSIRKRLLARFANDAASLGQALLWSAVHGAPMSLITKLADMILDAAETSRVPEAVMEAAREFSRRKRSTAKRPRRRTGKAASTSEREHGPI